MYWQVIELLLPKAREPSAAHLRRHDHGVVHDRLPDLGHKSVLKNKALVRKINLPREMFPVASVLVSMYHMIPMYVIAIFGCIVAGWTAEARRLRRGRAGLLDRCRLGSGDGVVPERLERVLPRHREHHRGDPDRHHLDRADDHRSRPSRTRSAGWRSRSTWRVHCVSPCCSTTARSGCRPWTSPMRPPHGPRDLWEKSSRCSSE